MYDFIIRNAHTVDGVNGERQADVCIAGDRIAALLPPNSGTQAARSIDATGLTLMPGLIDIHRHADLKPFLQEPWDELSQGLTTMISGNCGFSCVPNAPATFDAVRDYAAPILGETPEELKGMSTKAFFDAVESRPLPMNCGYLVGNGSLRRSVTGFSNAPLTSAQLDAVCALLDEALASGAMGLSMGIMYTPECYYATAELTQIARVAARHDKPVIAHIRGEGRSVVESIDEMIAIGHASGARIHISHMKAAGTDMWGHAMDTMLAHIEQARRDGLTITFDAYPYTAGSTTLLSLLPPEAMEGGTAGALRRIADPAGRAAILDAFSREQEGWDNFVQTLGWDRVIVAGSSDGHEAGRSIQALADQAGCEPGAFALDLLLREKGRVPVVLEEMAPDDVRKILSQRDSLVISDSLYSAAGKPHPRRYGAFPRFFRQYVKEEKLLSLQEAVDKTTRLPAEFLRIKDRGRLETSYYADLVLLDWASLRDTATYADPVRASEGIRLVLVNGKVAFETGLFTGTSSGRLLNRA
ncbi:MAG: amidohydrolase family protein [Eubacteriales bacterium]|nr:amidohydrolase family protein [Eubacteriales bacterium]